MNCHFDEALKCYVFAVHFNKARQERTNYRINISDDDDARDAWHCVFFRHQID
jgi:hypothetical protein